MYVYITEVFIMNFQVYIESNRKLFFCYVQKIL